MKNRLYLRADGNHEIGLGHVMRMLALADMVKDDFDLYFIIHNPSSSVLSLIQKLCKQIVILSREIFTDEVNEIDQLISDKKAWLVLDGYNFDTEYQKALKEKGFSLVSIDDIHPYPFVSDIIINHSPGIVKEEYVVESYTKLFLGSDYALLRQPFLEKNKESRVIRGIEKVMICFGGADPNNLTANVLQACLKWSFNEIHIVVGTVNKHLGEIAKVQQQYPNHTIYIHSDISAAEILDLMERNDLIICPSSTIVYEALCLDLNIISGYFVDNQKSFLTYLQNNGYVKSVGDWNQLSVNQIYDHIASFIEDYKPKIKLKLIKSNPTENIRNIFLNLFQVNDDKRNIQSGLH